MIVSCILLSLYLVDRERRLYLDYFDLVFEL